MKESRQKQIAYWTVFALLLAAVAFLCFFRLTNKYVDPWDEARHGVNAYEMLNGGSMIQSTYLRMADYYNLKPPLSMWCIMIGLKVFSDPVLGLRFYSAVCYLLLTLICGLFFRKVSPGAGLLAVGALGINMTPFLAHMVRAGDADSLYVLLFSLAMLAMVKIRDDHRWLYLCGLCFSLAFLAKSFHSFVIAAIGGLFLIISGLIRKIRFHEWLIFLLSILLPVALWAALRYRIDGTEFFVRMWETDVLGRTGGELHSNIAPFWYYLEYYFTPIIMGKMQVYTFSLLLILAAVLLAFAYRKKRDQGSETGGEEAGNLFRRDLITALILWIVIPFAAFSAVSNKLLWYVYPSLVGIQLAAALSADHLMKHLKDYFKPRLAKGLTAALIAALFLCWGYYTAGIAHIVADQSFNEFQVLVRSLTGDEKAIMNMMDMARMEKNVTIPEGEPYRGCEVFVDYDGSNSSWAQQDVFVAEAFGDYLCRDGGIIDRLAGEAKENKTGLIFVSRSTYENLQLFYEDCRMVAQTPNYLALEIQY